MKLEDLQMTLLFDYYGDLLTQKQQTCFDLYYNQDFSLAEIAEQAGISRQGVHDSLVRAEAALRAMEEKTGCVARAARLQRVAADLEDCAALLEGRDDAALQAVGSRLRSAAAAVKE